MSRFSFLLELVVIVLFLVLPFLIELDVLFHVLLFLLELAVVVFSSSFPDRT